VAPPAGLTEIQQKRMCLQIPAQSPLLLAQSGTNEKNSSAATASLSKAVDMGTAEYRLFEDDARKVKFKLTTSWIPGEKHQGMLRYKLFAWVDVPKPDASAASEPDESAEKLLKRVSRCTITLGLYGKDEFILRRHAVPFVRGIDAEHARLKSLFANDAFQMDSREYREFTNSGDGALRGIADSLLNVDLGTLGLIHFPPK
jgi:hypothetical protein